MFVKEKNSHQLNVWAETPVNLERVKKYSLVIYQGDIEQASDGTYWEKGFLPAPSKLTYCDYRTQEYPSIPEQLDMIYWDKVNGTNLWQEKIAEIKTKYPKE